jgi:nucleotide-binding universal stress UspA family protein
MFDKIMVPLDGSPLSEGAMGPALEMARRFEARVVLFRTSVLPEHLMVSPVPVSPATYTEIEQSILETTREYLEDMKDRHQDSGVPIQTADASGEAAKEILDFAQSQDIDLIVMSTHGRSGFQRWLFGSVAEKVMRHAPCPVLAVRPKEEEE